MGSNDWPTPDNNNVLIFIHIHKTGGTTIWGMLDKYEINYVGRNVHLHICNNVNPKEYNYMTSIRNPVDRAFSSFCAALRTTALGPIHIDAKTMLTSNDWSLLKKHNIFSNHMCTCLSGCGSDVIPGKKELDKAIENLLNFHEVIIFENFHQSCEQVFKRLTGKDNIEVGHDRILNKIEIPQGFMDACREVNELDIELYNTYMIEKSDVGIGEIP